MYARIHQVIFLAILGLACLTSYERLTINLEKTFSNSDIAAIFEEGRRINQGINPYSRINSGEANATYKPPTYLPGFYLLSSQIINIAKVIDIPPLKIWALLNSLIYLASGIIIYCLTRKINLPAAIILTACWFFSRWTLHNLASMQTNLIALIPLILSLVLITNKPKISGLLFGLSLSLKQLAIFLAPLYLIANWQNHKSIKKLIFCCCIIISLPLFSILPFATTDISGTFASLMYSANRSDQAPKYITTISQTKSVVMYLLMIYIFISYYLRQIDFYLSSLLVILTFSALNPIFFTQYYLWLLAVLMIYLKSTLARQIIEE